MDTETREEAQPDGSAKHRLTFGWCVYHRRHRGGRWSKGNWHRFDSVDGFWVIVAGYAAQGTRLDIYCHNAAFDAQVVAAIPTMEGYGWTLEFAVLEGPPTVITWRKGRATVRWLDTLNIWRLPLAAIGANIGLAKLDCPGVGVTGPEADTYCKRDVEIVWEALRRWWSFIQREDLGTVSPTLASQAFTAFRHRFMSHEVFCEANPDSLSISRDSYRGGRVELYQWGVVPGPITVVDVNSMYPYVMRDAEVPTKLLTVVARRPPEVIRDYLDKYAVVARVLLETDEPAYPVDHEGRLTFPVGRLVANLAGPELLYALDHGHVADVLSAAIYERAPLFRGFVDWCWGERLKALDEGREVDAWLYKIMGNSLYGKFGQRGRIWEFTGDLMPGVTADLSSLNLETHVWERVRAVGGQVQKLREDAESFNSFPAIAAYITAAARQYLYRLLQLVGPDSRRYCDTDSVWFSGTVPSTLSPYIDTRRLGGLKVEAVYDWVKLWGPKDYETPAKSKTKGLRKDAVQLEAGVYRQLHWTGWSAALSAGEVDAPRTYPVTKSITRYYTKGVVGPYCHVSPLTLSQW